MADVRRWTVPPDPITGEIELEELLKVSADAAIVAFRCGGAVQLVVGRRQAYDPLNGEPLPGEMVTSKAVIEWVSRTDTRPNAEVASDGAAEAEPPNGNGAGEEFAAEEELEDEHSEAVPES